MYRRQRSVGQRETAAGSANECGSPVGAGLANGVGAVWLCGCICQWCQRVARVAAFQ